MDLKPEIVDRVTELKDLVPSKIALEVKREFGVTLSMRKVRHILSNRTTRDNINNAAEQASNELEERVRRIKTIEDDLFDAYHNAKSPTEKLRISKELRAWLTTGIGVAERAERETEAVFMIANDWSTEVEDESSTD